MADWLSGHLMAPWWRQLVGYAPLVAFVVAIERARPASPFNGMAVWLNARIIATLMAIDIMMIPIIQELIRPPVMELSGALAGTRAVVGASPAWLQFLVNVAVLDFFYYWTHRWQHASSILWRTHELHHSDPHFNVTTTLRVHWAESALKLATVLTPAALLVEAPAGVPALLAFAGGTWLFFIHANARISFGPLNRVLVNPAVHRVHHSVEPRHHDKNFAAYFSFWDVLFGTYCEPTRNHWPDVGTRGFPPRSVAEAHYRPFLPRLNSAPDA